jgi:3-deoxy-D-manno-octulosonic acid (KDO) 8-phosphate synthase
MPATWLARPEFCVPRDVKSHQQLLVMLFQRIILCLKALPFGFGNLVSALKLRARVLASVGRRN